MKEYRLIKSYNKTVDLPAGVGVESRVVVARFSDILRSLMTKWLNRLEESFENRIQNNRTDTKILWEMFYKK